MRAKANSRKDKAISRKINELIDKVGRVLTLEEWMGIVKEYYEEDSMIYDVWVGRWHDYSKWRKKCLAIRKRRNRRNKHVAPEKREV